MLRDIRLLTDGGTEFDAMHLRGRKSFLFKKFSCPSLALKIKKFKKIKILNYSQI